MRERISRRRFLEASLRGGAGAAFFFPAAGLLAKATESSGGICVTLCNHWSYTGIGWQLGLESCVLSATDAMEMADRVPHVKTCLELDALAYKLMAEKFPEVAARRKKYLAADKVEVIGGTYGQPLGTMFSGESNIRHRSTTTPCCPTAQTSRMPTACGRRRGSARSSSRWSARRKGEA